jgi:hypothetical protein
VVPDRYWKAIPVGHPSHLSAFYANYDGARLSVAKPNLRPATCAREITRAFRFACPSFDFLVGLP